ncbi:hypothetical protein DFH07DRAFT_779044 [Mycena maculata]|uniref:Uncharacterized protein n=1 Tax=Mycena maculata TaxID=230809 RepID=A0AAD7I9P0_9AGAR|nr:hypothetical protein DFH07DRAFT_779044 [Mycena maculata]
MPLNYSVDRNDSRRRVSPWAVAKAPKVVTSFFAFGVPQGPHFCVALPKAVLVTSTPSNIVPAPIFNQLKVMGGEREADRSSVLTEPGIGPPNDEQVLGPSPCSDPEICRKRGSADAGRYCQVDMSHQQKRMFGSAEHVAENDDLASKKTGSKMHLKRTHSVLESETEKHLMSRKFRLPENNNVGVAATVAESNAFGQTLSYAEIMTFGTTEITTENSCFGCRQNSSQKLLFRLEPKVRLKVTLSGQPKVSGRWRQLAAANCGSAAAAEQQCNILIIGL